MRYSYEFKRTCVELYRKGLWADTPEGISTDKFHDTIRTWVRIEDACGPDALRHKNQNKCWTPEERYELVSRVLAGESIQSVAISVGMNSGTLYQWVRKYKTIGYNGLVLQKKGRPLKNSGMKKINYNNPKELNESEYEELIRLRAENEYIKTEIEVIKKEIALREKSMLRYSRRKSSNYQRTSRKMTSTKKSVKSNEHGKINLLL